MLTSNMKCFCGGGGDDRSSSEKGKEPSPIKHQEKD